MTNLSKRLIFHLHHIMTEGTKNGEDVAKIARPKLVQIEKLFVAMKGDLEGDQFWRYQRAVSPGLQEYIEALGFAHYLTHDSLITWQEVQDHLSDEPGSPVRFPPLRFPSHASYVLSSQTLTDHTALGPNSIFLSQLRTTCLECPTSRAS